MKQFTFPKKFLFGAATSAYQIEGAHDEDGRGPSTWDTFCQIPGRIHGNENGNAACDHYHRLPEDLGLMTQLNLESYRFSISWPRIFPEGGGRVNQGGVDFYNRLIDGLAARGIRPFATLFHWDLPQSLQDQYGGWKSKETSRNFSDYAAFCAKSFGDRVKDFVTMNEIGCFTWMAHQDDVFAPGGREDMATTLQTIKNAMVGHGWAVQAIKACRDIRVGLVENAQASVPLWASEENIGAARRAFRQRNQAILLPALSQGKNDFLDNSPEYTADEMKAAATPIDFLGFNYYKADTIIPSDDSKGFEILKNPLDFPKTDMGWTINPEGLYWSLRFINELAPAMPIFITENGIALRDRVEEDGSIRDIDRIQYMRSHLASVAKALEEDIPVKGYFAWSLLDNFEWASGYAKRFGLVRVDYQSMERRVKESGKYYGEIIRRRTLL